MALAADTSKKYAVSCGEEAHIARINDFLARIKVKLPQHFLRRGSLPSFDDVE
jgi:hypothetical protein